MHFYREQTERLRNSMSRGGTRAIEGRAERLKRLENLTYDEALAGQVLIGTPELRSAESCASCRMSWVSTAFWPNSIAAG